MRRLFLYGVAMGLVFVTGGPSSAHAGPGPETEDRGPWSRGVMAPSLGIGMSFGPSIHVLDFGLGFSYFVIDGLAVGLAVTDTVYIYRDDYKAAFPGIEDETPSNVVRLIPDLQYVFLRRFVFSPYIHAGVGPVFYNRDRGVVGEWITGVGAYIGLAPHFALSLGISVGANFPDDEWKEAFSYMGESIRGCALIDSLCSFNIFPRVGFVAFFGGGGGKRSKARSAPPEALPPSEAPDHSPSAISEPPDPSSHVISEPAPTDAPVEHAEPVEEPVQVVEPAATPAEPREVPGSTPPPPPTDSPPTDSPPTDPPATPKADAPESSGARPMAIGR